MIWLRSNEQYNTFIKLDVNSMVRKMHSFKNNNEKLPNYQNGFFSQCNDVFIAIYGHKGRLFFVVNEEKYEIKDDQTIEVSGVRSNRIISIMESEKIKVEFKYSLKGMPKYKDGDINTACIEEEDFDLGLLASNISKNLKRKRTFIDCCCCSAQI